MENRGDFFYPCREEAFPSGEGGSPQARRMRGQNPLLGEGGSAKPGREWGGAGSDLVPPLIRPCGATFPQGKVGVKNCTP